MCAPHLSKLKIQLGVGLDSCGIKSYIFLSKPFQNHPGAISGVKTGFLHSRFKAETRIHILRGKKKYLYLIAWTHSNLFKSWMMRRKNVTNVADEEWGTERWHFASAWRAWEDSLTWGRFTQKRVKLIKRRGRECCCTECHHRCSRRHEIKNTLRFKQLSCLG